MVQSLRRSPRDVSPPLTRRPLTKLPVSGLVAAAAALLVLAYAGGAPAQPVRVWQSVNGPHDGAASITNDDCPSGLCVDVSSPPECDGCAVVAVGTVRGVPGSELDLEVRFRAGQEDVSGIQNDLRFDVQVAIASCRANADLDKGLSGFRTFGTVLRAVIIGIDAVPLLDDVVLYTCRVEVAADASPGTYPLRISNLIGADPKGGRIQVTGADGAVVVDPPPPGSSPPPTRTPTSTPSPQPTIDPATVITLSASALTMSAGQAGEVSVIYASSGSAPSEMQADLACSSALRVAADADGTPRCRINPALHATASTFVFVPRWGAADCNVRVELFRIADLDPSGTVLYTCTVQAGEDVPPGEYPLHIENAVAARSGALMETPFPLRIVDGSITISAPPGTTPRPTWTATATVTATPTSPPPIVLDAGAVAGIPGSDVSLPVYWHRSALAISSLSAGMSFAPGVYVRHCDPTAGSATFGIAHVEEPDGASEDCTAGVDCNSVVAWIQDLAEVADGALLFTCTLHIGAGAASGTYPSSAWGSAISVDDAYVAVVGAHGEVVVSGGPTRTPTHGALASGQDASSATTGNTGGCAITAAAPMRPALPVPVLVFFVALLAARCRRPPA